MVVLQNNMKGLVIDELKRLLNYDPITGIFTWNVRRNWKVCKGYMAGTLDKDGYISILVNGKKHQAHKLAWFYHYGTIPEMGLDHRDVNPANNAINNLRLATGTQNQGNRHKMITNTSGAKGVCWDKRKKKWKAAIQKNRKVKNLGNFDTVELASTAYQKAAKEMFGEFARFE
jgi:hypothetical protein